MRLPRLLLVITFLSILFIGTSVAAQTSIESPNGQLSSSAQTELERASIARQQAEQQVITAQTALDAATAARQEAEQQLATVPNVLPDASNCCTLLIKLGLTFKKVC